MTSFTCGTSSAAWRSSSITSRLGAVEHSEEDRLAALDDDAEDRGGNEQADDRVGKRVAEPHRRPAPKAPPGCVQPSTRAWYPSAISAALLISWPTRMRKMATASLPRKPMIEAAITAPR